MYKHSAALLALVLLQTQALQAKELKLPSSAPVLALDLPSDWTLLSSSDVGLEAISPEKNSYLFMKILKRPVDDPNKWVRAVRDKLRAHGFAFGKVKIGPGQEVKAEMASPAPAEPALDSASKSPAQTQTAAAAAPVSQPTPETPVAPAPVAAVPEASPSTPPAAPEAPAAVTPPLPVIAAPEAPAAAPPAPEVAASAA
ncbi:MAG: hypothetical protein P4L76_17065, partial [Beijerinckiaceae bacterium]|nr:hypothetical protein [Beijerinckiaceae bacterium]